MKTLVALASMAVLALVSVTASAPSAATAAAPFSAHQEPLLGHLLVPGDRVEIAYRVDTPGVKSPTGSIYVRNNSMRDFERLELSLSRGPVLRAVLPARLLHGEKLLYFAIVRDAASGRSVAVPRAGARAPNFAFILNKPVIVRLGAHRFGQTREPEAVVARAGPDEVGFELTPPGAGPSTFLVGRDRSIWLLDGLNQRLLVWQLGSPDAVARTVALPPEFVFPGPGDIAFGPAGSLYVTRGIGKGASSYLGLYRLGANGEVLWRSRMASSLEANTRLRVGPDGTLYAVVDSHNFGRPAGEGGWMPLATPAGRPLSVAAQRRGTSWGYQPLARGLRLLSEAHVPPRVEKGPKEWRFALVDRADRIVRSWRVLSGTEIFGWFFTPQLVGGDPVVDLTVARPGTVEHVVLRLAPGGTRARFSLPVSVYGNGPFFSDLAVRPDGKLYRLETSPTTGVVVSRYSLR